MTETLSKKTILIVDDEEDLLLGLSKILSNAGYSIVTAQSASEGFEKARQCSPSLILLDVMLSGSDGHELKVRFNQDSTLADIPVIFLSAKGSPEDKLQGFGLQADDYVTKPFETGELLVRVARAIERKMHYEKISMTDSLTGIPNGHLFQKEVENIFNVAKRYQRPFSLAVADIDNLKAINDTLGHQSGDAAIRKVADILRQALRTSDLVFRYGGDEFVIVFPECSAEQAAAAIVRFKKKLSEGETAIWVSCGVVSYSDQFKTPAEMFALADKLMYQEKEGKK